MSNGDSRKPRVEMVDPQTARRWIEHGEVVLIDVREPHEYALERIQGATLVPLSSFDPHSIPDAGGKRLLLMCASGIRCGMASELLVRAGYDELYRLAGGLMGWKAAGGPVVQGP
jgi:rhodanese-related sulfurtransferase